MGEVISLHGFPIPLDGDLGRDFIADCCRYYENLMTEADIKFKYRFGDDVWEKLGNDDVLIKAIKAETLNRERTGATKRERAQRLVTKAPLVLGDILNDPKASPRHRIDSAKALDDFAANAPGAAAAGARFEITINLGADCTERYSRSIEINAQDVDPYNTSNTNHDNADDSAPVPGGLLAAFIKNKPGSNDGEPL